MKMEKVGYIKFYSKNNDINDSIVDLAALNETLSGIHDALLLNNTKRQSNLKIPISISEGSIIASIFSTLAEHLDLVTTTAAVYLGATAKKAAENGIQSTGLYIDTKKALQQLQKLVKLIKHVGGINLKEFVRNNAIPLQINNKSMIRIKNDDGLELEIEYEVFKLYLESRNAAFEKVVKLVEKDVVCQIVYFAPDGQEIIEDIEMNDKKYFQVPDENVFEIVMPEFDHQQHIELDGKIVKLHEDRDTLGFKTNGHVITCIPAGRQHIAMYKDLLISERNEKFFANVKIIGTINRFDKKGTFLNKPQILFSEIIPLETSVSQQNLF